MRYMLHHNLIHKKCEEMNFLCLHPAEAEEVMQNKLVLHTNTCNMVE